jgi:hypothetical protein
VEKAAHSHTDPWLIADVARALENEGEERAALAGELIQSLDTEVDSDAEAAWSVEIHERLARVVAVAHGHRRPGYWASRLRNKSG